MENRKTTTFRISGDDGRKAGSFAPGEPVYSGMRDSRRIEKLNRRVLLFSIFIPILMIGMFLVGFMILRSELQPEKNPALFNEINARLDEMGARLEGMGGQIEELKASVKKEDAKTPIDEFALIFQETVDTLKQSLKNMEDRVEVLKGGKIDIITLDEYKAEMAEQLKAASEEMETTKKSMGIFEERLAKIEANPSEKIAPLAEKLTAMEEKLTPLAEKIDPIQLNSESSESALKSLSAEVEQLRKDMVSELGKTMDAKGVRKIVNARVSGYNRKIKGLESAIATERQTVKRLREQVQALSKSVRSSRPRQMGTPKPGTVLEQDIQ